MKYYYDFGYFFNRKDSGSIVVGLTEKLDTDDVDSCIEIALKNNQIDASYASNVVYVEELTEEEAIEMGFKVEN